MLEGLLFCSAFLGTHNFETVPKHVLMQYCMQYLHLILYSMQEMKMSVDSFQICVDQRILQFDWTRGKAEYIKRKVADSDAIFS